MGDGGGGGSFFGGIFDSLLGSLVAVIEAIIAFLQELVVVLVGALNYLFAYDQAIAGFSLLSVQTIFSWFQKVLGAIFHTGLLGAIKYLLSLYQKLRTFLLKLKAWLDRFHALQQKYQLKALRDFLNLIQRVRRILVIFRIFHLKFATKLDNWLAGIEGKVVSRLFTVARKTNTIIGWMNWLLDPIGQIKRQVLVRSIATALDDIAIALTGKSWAAIFGLTLKVTGTARNTRPISDVMKNAEDNFIAGTGDEGAIVSRGAALLDAAAAEMGVR